MDEISQVVELECKGVYYLLKGTKEMIAYFAKRIVALADWKHELYLKKAGECSWEKLQEISKGTPVLLNFPKEMFEPTFDNPSGEGKVSAFDLYCQENNLRYCILPDLNPDDDFIPVGVPAQDAGIHSEQIKHYMKMKVEAGEAKVKQYDEEIAKAKDEFVNAKTDEGKEVAKRKLEALEQGKSEKSENLAKDKAQMDKDNVLEFSEYLQMGKGTLFEKDPKAALAQEQICGIIREYMPDDCMYTIRDEGLVPDSKEVFYSQKSGEDTYRTVRRTFKKDDNGTVFSTYKVEDPKEPGNIRIFSDKGMSKEAWKEQLPGLLSEAGMLANVPAMAIRSEERLRKYMEGLDVNFTKAPREEGQLENISYSNPDAKEYIEAMKLDNEQRATYEDSLVTTVTVPANMVLADDQHVLSLELAEGIVKDVELVSMDSEEAQVRIKSDTKYFLEREGGKPISLSGDDIISAIEKTKNPQESMAAAKNAARK